MKTFCLCAVFPRDSIRWQCMLDNGGREGEGGGMGGWTVELFAL